MNHFFILDPIVAAAFASLLQEDRSQENSKGGAVSNETDEKIINAETVNDLLRIPGQTKVTRKHALKVVRIVIA